MDKVILAVETKRESGSGDTTRYDLYKGIFHKESCPRYQLALVTQIGLDEFATDTEGKIDYLVDIYIDEHYFGTYKYKNCLKPKWNGFNQSEIDIIKYFKDKVV